MIRLFEMHGKVVKPTENCHTIKWLKAVMDHYEDEAIYMNAYAYLFYMTCPNHDNPYFQVGEDEKEDQIIESLEMNFDPEDDVMIEALEKCTKLFETPTVRAYMGMKQMLDNLSTYMGSTKIEHGRDGNISAIISAAKNFDAIRDSFKGVAKDLQAEQDIHVRGNKRLSYDQKGT